MCQAGTLLLTGIDVFMLILGGFGIGLLAGTWWMSDAESNESE